VRVLLAVVAIAGFGLAAIAGATPFGILSRWPELAPLADGSSPLLRAALGVGALAVGVAALFGWRATSAARARPLSAALAAPLILLVLTSHLLVRPFLDPVKGLARGALAVAHALPPGEALLAFDPDETTLAVVPFYGGRFVREVSGEALPEALARAGTNHLLAMPRSLRRLPEATRTRLQAVREIVFTPTRSITLYELAP